MFDKTGLPDKLQDNEDSMIKPRHADGVHRCRKLATVVQGIAVGFGLLGLTTTAAWRAEAHDIGWAVGNFAPHQQRSEVSPLARTQEPTVPNRQKTGTGFFVDDKGHMLTARHAAEDCSRLIVFKEGRALAAQLVALSPSADIALIKVSKTLGLAAVFPSSVGVSTNDMVFASAYDKLATNRGMFANATVAGSPGSQSGVLQIDTDVTFGASGAPVLDSRGLVQGIISRRTGSSRVVAVGAGDAKSFLASKGVRVAEDDRSQIVATTSRSSRAASISARVTCLQN
ncbi:serine protease [Bradyrhizobium sp. 31Argb]|uniref:S1 family peptidase n=1 Tax=Bradyrhizobium sp. 31Argb TaxID=3141247 RepID=UPI003749112C